MGINIDKFTTHLRKNACERSQGRCARWVRQALEAGGAKTSGYPIYAKDWGPTLLRIGFQPLSIDKLDQFNFKKGDVVVLQPHKSGNPAGHIAGFDGKSWISDFVQNDIWSGPAYRKEKPSYVVYRP